ncbi:MAG: universal stress protein [Cyanobacteria bacterium]|nr:universal stress protein [Cyanobacteriota bacterium]MDW8199950.1 universal stress protein [Cyanobacteriota bacterium SKYGB_h_bin112]
MFKTLLFPIDHSRESMQAAESVAQLVKTFGSRLVLLSVVEDAADGTASSTDGMASPEAVAALLTNVQNLFAEQGITAEAIERQGKPAFTICDVADETEADLIVMGFRGMGLTEEGMADSVTMRVINLSPCPVLVIP